MRSHDKIHMFFVLFYPKAIQNVRLGLIATVQCKSVYPPYIFLYVTYIFILGKNRGVTDRTRHNKDSHIYET